MNSDAKSGAVKNGKPGLGWLIEYARNTSVPLWLCHDEHRHSSYWGPNANDAKRFDSEKEANDYIYQHGMNVCKATQHEWVGL